MTHHQHKQCIDSFEDLFERFFDSGLPRKFPPSDLLASSWFTNSPRARINTRITTDSNGNTILAVGCAGYAKEDISVEYDENSRMLEIVACGCNQDSRCCESGTHCKEDGECDGNKENCNSEEETCHCVNAVSYRYRLGEAVVKELITAEYKDGLLKITVASPKKSGERTVSKIDIL